MLLVQVGRNQTIELSWDDAKNLFLQLHEAFGKKS
jgi:hypothetical protein